MRDCNLFAVLNGSLLNLVETVVEVSGQRQRDYTMVPVFSEWHSFQYFEYFCGYAC